MVFSYTFFLFDPPLALYVRMQIYLKHNASESSEYKNNADNSHIIKNQQTTHQGVFSDNKKYLLVSKAKRAR